MILPVVDRFILAVLRGMTFSVVAVGILLLRRYLYPWSCGLPLSVFAVRDSSRGSIVPLEGVGGATVAAHYLA